MIPPAAAAPDDATVGAEKAGQEQPQRSVTTFALLMHSLSVTSGLFRPVLLMSRIRKVMIRLGDTQVIIAYPCKDHHKTCHQRLQSSYHSFRLTRIGTLGKRFAYLDVLTWAF